MRVQCECGGQYAAKAPLEQVEHSPGVFSVGVRCPHCQSFTHSFYEDESTRELQQALDRLGPLRRKTRRYERLYMATLDQFSRAFDALQARCG